MGWTKYIFTLWIAFFAMVSLCQAESLDQYQQKLVQIQALHKKISSQDEKISTLQQTLNKKGEEISQLKEVSKLSFLQKIALQKKMQEAQELSKQLDQLYTTRSQSSDQLSAFQKTVIRSIETDLSKAYLYSKDHTQALMNLHKQVSKLDFQTKQDVSPKIAIEQTPPEDSTSVEQWIVLQDLQLYTKDLISQTREALAYEKQQKVLRKELSHLMNEEIFFGEQGFIQGTARKQNSATIAVTSEDGNTQNPSTPTDTPSDEPADPTGTTPDPEAPTVEDPSTDVTTEADITTPDTNFQDIDPKVQSMVMDNSFPDAVLQEQNKGIYNEDFDLDLGQRDKLLENPNEITNAILSLSPQEGESKVEFLHRKVEYLNDILVKLQRSSHQIKLEIESHKNED